MRENRLWENAPARHGVLGISAFFFVAAALANEPPAPQDPPVTADIYVYPANGQSDRQLDRDRYECHGWSVKQSGYDPSLQSATPRPQSQVVVTPPDHRGAVNGAVAGAIIGASVSGHHDSAEGALVGAVAGAMIGAVSDVSRAREAAGHTSRQSATGQARLEKQAYDYRRAISACLEGRGYTVK